MMKNVVIDTNVPVVANRRHPKASVECILACIAELTEHRGERKVLIDNQGLILEEYRRQLSLSGQPGVGDEFFKWLWDNQGNPRHCRRVAVTLLEDGTLEEFPQDPLLAEFDVNDRKFVATAIASKEEPPILNASDTDWWDHKERLKFHGIQVRFLCPELMGGGER